MAMTREVQELYRVTERPEEIGSWDYEGEERRLPPISDVH